MNKFYIKYISLFKITKNFFKKLIKNKAKLI